MLALKGSVFEGLSNPVRSGLAVCFDYDHKHWSTFQKVRSARDDPEGFSSHLGKQLDRHILIDLP